MIFTYLLLSFYIFFTFLVIYLSVESKHEKHL